MSDAESPQGESSHAAPAGPAAPARSRWADLSLSEWIESMPNLKSLFTINPLELFPYARPPRLKKDGKTVAAGSGSTSSRAPAFYDKHFDKRLILLHVDRYPEMTRDLKKNLDKLMLRVKNDPKGTFPPDSGLPNEEAIEGSLMTTNSVLSKEIDIQTIYESLGKHYLRVASTLLFHPNHSKYGSLLTWTTDGTATNYAIADGVLSLLRHPQSGRQAIAYDACLDALKAYHPRRHKLLQNMASADFVPSLDIATWEMKSLTVGSEKKMAGLLNNFCGKKFNWELCEYGKVYCTTTHGSVRNTIRLTYRGVDAKDGMRYRLPSRAPLDVSRLHSHASHLSFSAATQSQQPLGIVVDRPDSPESIEVVLTKKMERYLRDDSMQEDPDEHPIIGVPVNEDDAASGLVARPTVEGPPGPIHDVMEAHIGTGKLPDPAPGEGELPYRDGSLPAEQEFPENRTIGSTTINLFGNARLDDDAAPAPSRDRSARQVAFTIPRSSESESDGESDGGIDEDGNEENEGGDDADREGDSSSDTPQPRKRRYQYPSRAERDTIPDDPGGRAKPLTTRYLIQQAWAQAVRSDGTFLVISTGNHEYIGIRDRANQALFLSKLVRPHKYKGYGKLQVALYVAAVQDAMDRRQINHGLSDSDGYPSNDQPLFSGSISAFTDAEVSAAKKKEIGRRVAKKAEVEQEKQNKAKAKAEAAEAAKVAKAAKTLRGKSRSTRGGAKGRRTVKGKTKAKTDETDEEAANASGSDGGRPGPSRRKDADDDDSDHDAHTGNAGQKRSSGTRGSKATASSKRRKMNDTAPSTTSAAGHQGGRARASSPPRTRNSVRREKAIFQNVHAEALLRHTVCLSLRYDLYDSIYPAVFTRVGSGTVSNTGPKIAAKKTTVEEEPATVHDLRITLTSEVGRGLLGLAHGGILELPAYQDTDEMSPPINIVAKIALNAQSRSGLKAEHAVYAELHAAGVQGIPTLIGLFEDKEDDAYTLIMTPGGNCLTPGKPVASDQFRSFMKTLRAIHDAGFVHNDLRPANLLVDEDGNTCIIDFHRSGKTISQARQTAEVARLQRILDGNWTEEDATSSF